MAQRLSNCTTVTNRSTKPLSCERLSINFVLVIRPSLQGVQFSSGGLSLCELVTVPPPPPRTGTVLKLSGEHGWTQPNQHFQRSFYSIFMTTL